MQRALWIGLGVLLLAAAAYTLRTLQLAGTFRSIEPHARGVESCRHVAGPVGAEDLTVHPETGLAFVSAADRRATARGEPVPGAIWSYDLATPEPEPVVRTPDADLAFQPHGISLWRGPGGEARLFVVSHPPGAAEGPRHTVELFDVRGAALSHRATFTREDLVMPNDLVAVGPEHFYLTSTHANPPGLLQTLETFLRLPGGSVLYRGPQGWRTALSGLRYPNGINVSSDGGTLYVATTTGGALRVYDRDAPSEQLALRRTLPLRGGDNIEVDAEGTLWIGAHPKLFAVAAHRDDPESPAPSQVLRVDVGGGGGDDAGEAVEEVLLRTGERFAAASVAARFRDRLLVGQIFGEGLLDCTLTPASR